MNPPDKDKTPAAQPPKAKRFAFWAATHIFSEAELPRDKDERSEPAQLADRALFLLLAYGAIAGAVLLLLAILT